MTWNDRLKEAAYTSPSGTRIVFDFEDVSKSVEKKTAAFEFPDANGTYIQDLGHTGRRYPFRAIFWGDDYDLALDQFEEMLLEVGVGFFEHPKYGTIDVVPFGEIKRRDDLKTAANQGVMEVVFFQTIGIVYPISQVDPASEVLNAIQEFNSAAAEEFDELTDLDSAVEQISFKSKYQAVLDVAQSGLQSVADTQENVEKQFNAIVDSINAGIDILVRDPITLAFQTSIMIQAPARALTSIQARLSAYGNLITALITGDNALFTQGYDSSNSNDFHNSDLFSMSYVTGSVVSAINTEFSLKKDAIGAADEILSQFDSVVAWRDLNFASLSEIDTGSAYQKLQTAVSLLAGFLVQLSFSLKQERTIIVDRPRSIIDLVAELYGEVDSQLDFFITSNDLSGSEILEIPPGREIVYYV